MIKQNKTALSTAVALALGGVSMGAQAAITTSAILEFAPGVYTCVANSGTPPNNCYYSTNVKNGSWFGMDADGNSTIAASEKTALVMHDGIHIGATQTAAGSHTGGVFGANANPAYTGTGPIQTGVNTQGTPNDPSDDTPTFMTDGGGNQIIVTTTEQPGLDEPWAFFGNTGMDYTTSPISVVQDNGLTKTLDFSGWTVTWNNIATIPMNAGSWGGGAGNGLALITCDTSSCSGSSTFSLDYYATVPVGDPSGFGGVQYHLHLEGGHVVDAPAGVPIPAAAWLFGSGLVGLVGVARRKKSS